MSVMQIDTTNRNGQRPGSSYKASNIVAVFRAPAETPPMPALYPTRRLSKAASPAGTQSQIAAEPTHVHHTTPRTMTKRAARRAAAALGAINPLMPASNLRTVNWVSEEPSFASVAAASPTPSTSVNATPTTSAPVTPANNFRYGSPIFRQAPPVSMQTSPTPTTQSITPSPSTVSLQTNGPSAQTAQVGTPVPVGWPTNQSYIDSSGNVWTYTSTAGWQNTGTVSSLQATVAAGSTTAGTTIASTTTTAVAQTGTPVPAGYPTDEAYVDASGNTWTWTSASGWTITAAASIVGSASDWFGELTTWLQSSTIFSGVQNFWTVAGVGAAGIVLWGTFTGGKKR
jgi:hypothetical protein